MTHKRKIEVVFTDPQWEFLTSESPFPAMVSGFGAGKSHTLIARAIQQILKYGDEKLLLAAYYPTYDLCRNIGFPRFEEMLDMFEIPYVINRSSAHIDILGNRVLFRTLDNPDRIVGYETADAIVDELDTISARKGRDVWHKILARNRQKKPNGEINTVAVASTPEGFGLCYELWGRDPKPGYHLIKASTYSNASNLPAGYIDHLKDIYPSALLSAYLDGEFVNLTSGAVYPDFSRTENNGTTTATLVDTLHIGMDFNVQNMAAVVCVIRNRAPYVIGEITGILDTPSMIAAIKRRYPSHPIMVYPDASGGARNTRDASRSDLYLLKQEGWAVRHNPANPAVKDRVMAVNAMLFSGGQRRIMIDVEQCPSLTDALSQQVYTEAGEPDKKSGHDHIVDAFGYFVAYRYPVSRAKTSNMRMAGM